VTAILLQVGCLNHGADVKDFLPAVKTVDSQITDNNDGENFNSEDDSNADDEVEDE